MQVEKFVDRNIGISVILFRTDTGYSKKPIQPASLKSSLGKYAMWQELSQMAEGAWLPGGIGPVDAIEQVRSHTFGHHDCSEQVTDEPWFPEMQNLN